MHHLRSIAFQILLIVAGVAWLISAQSGNSKLQGSVERIKVHAKGLEGNLAGDSADRDVSIYLPPSYRAEPKRRYPVIYMLHGFTDSDALWFGFQKHWINFPEVVDKVMSAPGARQVIVVMPNAFTAFQGSMYSNSVTTGNWEEFVAKELVSYIDSHYRTISKVGSRGLAGHSMGGYGTLRIGMKHPDVFSSLYALNPCCLIPNLNPQQGPGRTEKAEAVRSLAEIANADFMTKAALASAAAWSPNPKKGPLFIDLPWQKGEFQPTIAAKWAANAPLAMIDQYITNIRQLRAIAFDAGTQEDSISATAKMLHQVLTDYGVAHTSEIYEGNHTNRVAERIEKNMLPFFARALAFN